MTGQINPYDDNETIIQSLSLDDSLLDILIELEDVLDKAHMYAYKNWKKGVICKGPDITRHWVKIVLRYPYEQMPDPEAAKRLLKMRIRTEFEKAILEVKRKIETPDDIDPLTRSAKVDEVKVWYVTMMFPREFVENIKPSSDLGVLPVSSQPDNPGEGDGYGA